MIESESFIQYAPYFFTILPLSYLFFSFQWVPEITKHNPKTPFLLVGLKSDLRDDPETISKLNKSKKQPISQEAGMNYSKQVRAAGYLECSARTQVSTCLDTAMKF